MTGSEFVNAEIDPTVRRTRETWLEDAIAQMRTWFDEVGFPLPERVHVSVGFSLGARRESAKILGTCWARYKSEDGVNHIFLSPEIADAVKFLIVLVHELIHAADDNQSGHKGKFAEIATRLGLINPLTDALAGPELTDKLTFLAIELGDFPHSKLNVSAVAPVPAPVGPDGEIIPIPRGTSGPGKQGTRMIKCVCPECGFTMRTTRRWIDGGLPTCVCGGEIAEAE